MNQTKKISLGVSVLAVAGSMFFTPAGMSAPLFRGLVLTCVFMLDLVTGALPVMLMCLLTLGILSLMGITESFAASFGGFSNQAVFFVMMSFGLAAVLMETPLCRRILKWFFDRLGKNIEGLILANMVCAAITSAFISDVPTTVIYMTFGELILAIYSREESRRKTGRCMMIGTSLACMIGGISTPVGSTVNIIALSVLTAQTGETIGFVQWMIVCVPVAAILVLLSWKILVTIYKPSPVDDDDRVKFIDSFADEKPMSAREKRTIVLFAAMFILWVTSSWIRQISTMQVMFLGVCIMALPVIGVTNIDNIMKNVKFDILFLVATMITLCSALMDNGFGDLVAGMVPAGNISVPVVVLGVVISMYVLILIIPIAPSLTTVATPTLIVIAQSMGISPLLLIPVCSMSIGCGYLLPTDSVFLLTYGKGYYSIRDFMKVSAIVMAVAAVLITVVGYPIMRVVGIG